MSETENRGGEAAHNDNNKDDYNPGNFPRAIVPIQDVSEILSKYDFKEKIGTGGASLIVQFWFAFFAIFFFFIPGLVFEHIIFATN